MVTPDSISPRQRLIDAHRAGVRQIERAQIPLYWLARGWTGVRTTGNTCETGVTRDEHGVTGELNETVELRHEQGASRLYVESSDQVRSIDDGELLELLGRDGECGPRTISVDAGPIAFAAARADDVFVARWVGYEVTLAGVRQAVADGVRPGVGVRITDLAPYHEGRVRLLETRSEFDLRG